MKLTERRILKRTRKCSLWAFLVAAAVTLVIAILETWNVLETQDLSRFGQGGPTAWGRIENTASIIMAIGLLILLTILVANRAKSDGGAGKKAPKAAAVKSTAKAVTSKAKKPAPKK